MNAVDVLTYGNLTFHRVLQRVPEGEWERGGACGRWSVKDLTAHLASFEHLLVEVLCSFLEGGPTPYLDSMAALGPEAFSDLWVEQRRANPPEAVLSEYDETHAETMLWLARIPTETLRQTETLPWYGPEYALDDFFVYQYYGHKREHSGQIAVFCDQFGA
ncbi:MAG TPA: maleylpyruvate isomerase N-terminal domain-containing protein [Ardenticatenaceae bacterium]